MFWGGEENPILAFQRTETFLNGAHLRRFEFPKGGVELSSELQSVAKDLSEGLLALRTSFNSLYRESFPPTENETLVLTQACLQHAVQRMTQEFHVVPVFGMKEIEVLLPIRQEYWDEWSMKYSETPKERIDEVLVAVTGNLAVAHQDMVEVGKPIKEKQLNTFLKSSHFIDMKPYEPKRNHPIGTRGFGAHAWKRNERSVRATLFLRYVDRWSHSVCA